MRRRELVLLLGGAMTAARALRAQQKAMPVIGFLHFASPGRCTVCGRVPPGAERDRLCRSTTRNDRRPLGGVSLGSPARIGRRSCRREGRRDRGGRPPFGTRGEECTLDDPYRLLQRRPGRGGSGRWSRSAGRQPHGREPPHVELMAKRLELLSELVPQAGVIALLVNPNDANAERIIKDVQEAARAKGVQLAILKAGSEREIDAAFPSLVQLQAGGLVVGTDPFFFSRREQLVALASRHALRAIY